MEEKFYAIRDHAGENNKYISATDYDDLIGKIRNKYKVDSKIELRLVNAKTMTFIEKNQFSEFEEYTKIRFMKEGERFSEKVDQITSIKKTQDMNDEEYKIAVCVYDIIMQNRDIKKMTLDELNLLSHMEEDDIKEIFDDQDSRFHDEEMMAYMLKRIKASAESHLKEKEKINDVLSMAENKLNISE